MQEGVRAESTGDWGDFQQGPSLICPQHSFGFAFEDGSVYLSGLLSWTLITSLPIVFPARRPQKWR